MKETAAQTPIERAIAILGGTSKAAEVLGTSVQTVSNWHSRGVPLRYVPHLAKATGYAVTCEELRPDFAWELVAAKAGGQRAA